MRFWMAIFLISLVAFVFFSCWTIQTIWLASFFSKNPASFELKMGSLLTAVGLCFVSMVGSGATYVIRRRKAQNRQ
jgi:hypothetical protein